MPSKLSPASAKVFDALVRMLRTTWPSPVKIGPAFSEMHGADAVLRALQAMSDAGMITYEAMRIGANGLEVIDAALTARGRSLLAKAA